MPYTPRHQDVVQWRINSLYVKKRDGTERVAQVYRLLLQLNVRPQPPTEPKSTNHIEGGT